MAADDDDDDDTSSFYYSLRKNCIAVAAAVGVGLLDCYTVW